MTEELDSAAKKYVQEITFDDTDNVVENAFKAGATWCAEYIIKCMIIMQNNNPKL